MGAAVVTGAFSLHDYSQQTHAVTNIVREKDHVIAEMVCTDRGS